ncbi:MAG: DUF4190 domain-containing protein [Clostridia bacterium]|nr:DUF4190 domain-containing protein [Clostridia bacterium]NCC44267.1 DUF4190 domain-containing protein [Clostridia bacterium]
MDENQHQDWNPNQSPDTNSDDSMNTANGWTGEPWKPIDSDNTPDSPNLQGAPDTNPNELGNDQGNPGDPYNNPNNQWNQNAQNNQWNQNNPYNNQGNPWNQNQNNQNNQWNQNNPYNNQGYRPLHSSPNGFMVASLVMGILSIVLICCGFSFFFGALGILFAILSRREGKMEAQAKVGLGLSIAGTVLGLVIILIALFGSSEYYKTFINEYERFYNEYEDNYNSDGSMEDIPDIQEYLERYGNGNDWNTQLPDSGESL